MRWARSRPAAARAAILLAATIAAAAPGQIVETPETKVIPRLTVRGDTELRRPADQLRLTVGVVTENDEASAALDENTARMERIVAALRETGLVDGEWETGRFRVRPTYSRRPRQSDPEWRPRIVGYEVSNTVDVRTGKLDLAGPLIEAANKAGANSIDGIAFDLADPRRHRSEAIAEATANARADARVLAEAAGIRLIRLLSVTLDDAGARAPTLAHRSAVMATAEAAAPPITPGDVAVTASVTMVYEIGPKAEASKHRNVETPADR